MGLYKRGKTWWIDLTTPDGQRIQESSRTTEKVKAQEYHDHRKAEAWRVTQLKERPKHTWEQAVVRRLKETSHKKSIEDDKLHFRKLHTYLSGKYLHNINRDLIDQITQSRLSDGVSNATVNRMLEVLRATLNAAERQWDWIDRAPHIRMLKEAKRRIRYLTQEQVALLLAELPNHLRDIVVFSLSTGLRKSNVTQIKWDQIDLDKSIAWIHADEAKGAKSIPVALNSDAIEILKAQKGNHPKFDFTYREKPVKEANTKAWRDALKRAEITDFRFHDLRHTWASWHIQNGTPLHILQEMGSWESPEMVRRYAHLSAEHLAPYSDNVTLKKTSNVTNPLQSKEKGK